MSNLSSNIDGDLNQVIASAVNAKIESQVAAALAGDEVIGQYVAAALRQEVQPDRYNSRSKTTFLTHTLTSAIQTATKKATAELIAEQEEVIKLEVRKALRGKIGELADAMVDELKSSTGRTDGYRVNVAVSLGKDR